MTTGATSRLDLRETAGVWAVRSQSTTVYYVDVDVPALLRQTGSDSEPGPADDQWVPLVSLRAIKAGDDGVIRVGDRHQWVFDYDVHARALGWWIQRRVTRIEQLTDEQITELPARLPGSNR